MGCKSVRAHEPGCPWVPHPGAASSCLLWGWESDSVIGFLMPFFSLERHLITAEN